MSFPVIALRLNFCLFLLDLTRHVRAGACGLVLEVRTQCLSSSVAQQVARVQALMLLASLVKADTSTSIVDAVHASGLPSRLLQDLATTPPVTLLQVWVTQPADLVRHGSRVITDLRIHFTSRLQNFSHDMVAYALNHLKTGALPSFLQLYACIVFRP